MSASAAIPLEPRRVRPKLESRGLHARFGKNHVLRGIDLELPEKAVTAVIGPSGCGKSTFVRCLNRMHELGSGATLEGKVLLDGNDIYERNVDPVAVRRRVGMVFQRPNPFPTLSIRDNVLVGRRIAGVDEADTDEIVEKTLSRVGLWEEVKDSLMRSGASLSGGQQQRLCIARSLAVEPEALLMDEPCSALDPTATARIEDLVCALGKEVTIVMVTHSLQQAARVAEHTAFFYMGELVEFARSEQLFTTPREQRTEDYLTGRFG